MRSGRRLIALEVKTGRARDARPGFAAFGAEFKPARTLLVGGDGLSAEEFLEMPLERWMGK